MIKGDEAFEAFEAKKKRREERANTMIEVRLGDLEEAGEKLIWLAGFAAAHGSSQQVAAGLGRKLIKSYTEPEEYKITP